MRGATHTTRTKKLVKQEKITYERYNPEAWICICKNTPDDSGFYECSADGIPCEPLPGVWDGLSYLCNECGRIINQRTLKVTGKITVKELRKRVDIFEKEH